MRYNKILLILILTFLIFYLQTRKLEKFSKKKNCFKVVVTFYNPGKKYLEKCLKSIKEQTYSNFDVCLVNDKSTKEINEINKLCEFYKNKYAWKCLNSKKNNGPYKSRMAGIEKLKPNDEDIIVLIDGDDTLHNNNVFEKLNDTYQYNTKVTFGNFIKVNSKGYKSAPKVNCNNINIKKLSLDNTFRNERGYIFSHLKTFKYGLYKRINHTDNKVNGEFIKSATDAALMYPLLELSGENTKCINEVLYDYTVDHVESLHNDKNKKKKQKNNLYYLKSLKKYNKV